MTQLKQRPQIAIAGVVMLAVVIAVILGFSGTFMGAQEDAAPVEAPPVEVEEAPEAPAEAASADDPTFVGDFDPNGEYRITGQAVVLEGDDGARTLRLTEEFSTPRGPQLVIYLRAESGEFVNLGALQSLSGEQDFEIPADIDISEFSEVQVWCEPFGINFGSAFVSAA